MKIYKNTQKTKKPNFLKIFPTTMFFFMVLFLSKNAFGLGWADREWISSGCPSKILGVWKSRSNTDKDSHKIKISKNIISLTMKTGTKKKFFFGKSKFIKQARFLQVSLKEGDLNSKDFEIWKIRPHLTWKRKIKTSEPIKKADCLIKILRFENQKKARFDKYKSWDIYERSYD